ncbi:MULTISPECIES: extracellular solute-binding protein [unclassified Legionella]|uniref:extracellular solute-binding protein n=1 Tax=unclassified Legionella TaxID=2622702 RepID=UPI0010564D65|nr:MULTISPECIES: extracellular solute-binding protein [unclassified Legionella]MDI9818536.1 extracellular solute-binding protein [Legionella sp. PL877]
MSRLFTYALLFFIYLGCLQARSVEIIMWHSLAGYLGDEINQLTSDFNRRYPDYLIKPVYKGEYTEAITSFAAAFRAKQPPDMVQIFEVGTATVLHPEGIIKPVDDIMREQGINLPKASFLSAVRSYYSDDQHLLAMPFNISVPVIYYNADVLAKLGYTPDKFPQTWQEMEILAERLKRAGSECVYTTAYPAWIHLESFSAIHGLPMIDASHSLAVYNNPAIIRHLNRLKNWQEKNYFEYGGRTNDATVLFTSGRCPLFSQSSGSYNSLSELVKFRLGVAPLPLDTSITTQRHNNVAGGAAFWAVSGRSPQIYRGMALFFAYIAQPDIQQRWHEHTGYLPLGLDGIYASLTDTKHPILGIAKLDLANEQDSVAKCSGPQNLIRAINDEALESIFAGIKTPQQAINEAVARANYTLMRFVRNTKQTIHNQIG